MSQNQYIQKIDRYLSKDEKMPLIVDVQNEIDQSELVQHYHVGKNLLVSANNYCAPDGMPQFDALLNDLVTKDGVLIVTGVSSFLKLEGEYELQKFIRQLLGICITGHVIFITFQCKRLPSITSLNKEFIELFSDSKFPIVSIKELDDIKHHGKYNYDFYKNSKLPIHLIKELEVIKSVLVKIKDDLSEGIIKRAFVIADHGSSRLAVLHDTENIWEMAEKGLHSGRCCLKSEIDKKPDFAADAGRFWALANYDRFKGGRKANVEVHGGATLEELCIPIIELTYLTTMPEIILMPVDEDDFSFGAIPEIEVSFRKKAAIKVFSTVALKNVGLSVNGKYYVAEEMGNNYYRVDMPDLKKAGTYFADVQYGNNVIAEKLPFIIKKEGQRVKDLL